MYQDSDVLYHAVRNLLAPNTEPHCHRARLRRIIPRTNTGPGRTPKTGPTRRLPPFTEPVSNGPTPLTENPSLTETRDPRSTEVAYVGQNFLLRPLAHFSNRQEKKLDGACKRHNLPRRDEITQVTTVLSPDLLNRDFLCVSPCIPRFLMKGI